MSPSKSVKIGQLIVVLKRGELRPGHLKARKPQGVF
jgi:hypothetical protein